MMNQKPDSFYFDPDKIAEAILLDYLFDPNPDEIPGKEHLSKGRYTLASWCGDFYQWAAGRWSRVSDLEIDLRITRHLQSHNSSYGVNVKQEPVVPISKSRIANIRLCLAGRVLRPEIKQLNEWDNVTQDSIITLSMNNGLLILGHDGQAEIIPHTPDYFSFIQLPYGYELKAQCPTWLNFLNDITLCRQDYILLLQQWCGYLLRSDLRQQKFLLCVGEGANGKGVFFEVVQNLVGVENCSQVPIAQLHRSFSLAATIGKMVNLTHESAGKIEESAETTLKSFVAGDRMEFERKFREPFSGIPTAKIMVATNDLPRFNDKSQAVWRRILLVPFDKVVAEAQQITTLAEKLKKELPGILNWALEGLRNLNAAGRFTVPANSRELIEQYRQDSNPARAFLLENYESTNNGDIVPCEDVYRQYRGWCEGNGHQPLSNGLFGKEVKRVYPDIERNRPGSGNARNYVYTRLRPVTSYES
jgi:P4 family phage/plasmid primase-like protien